MSLFGRIFGLNALVLGAATALLLWAPVTVSVPVLLTEAFILVGGLAVMLVANAALLRWGLAPLGRLTKLMTTVDLLRPGQRLPVPGAGGGSGRRRVDGGGRGAAAGDGGGFGDGGEVTELIRTFNAMLDRLEHERATSSARALLAQEAERRRIAQELHDEVGQSMTAILLVLKRAADDADEPLREELRQAQEITRDSLDEVRRLVRRLRPGVLDDLGLVSALTSLTRDFATHTGLHVVRRFDTDLPALAPETELVLYRVAQESLTNAARHAEASRVEVGLRRVGDAVELEIADDGRGIEAACEGAGIRGMRERALLAGAALDLTSEPASGTRIRLTTPPPGSSAPASDSLGSASGSPALVRSGSALASRSSLSASGSPPSASGSPIPASGSPALVSGSSAPVPSGSALASGSSVSAPGSLSSAPGSPASASGSPAFAPSGSTPASDAPASASGSPAPAPSSSALAPGSFPSAPGSPPSACGSPIPASGSPALAPRSLTPPPGSLAPAPGAPIPPPTIPTATRGDIAPLAGSSSPPSRKS